MSKNPYFNNSGCADPTAYEALKPLIEEENVLDKRVHNLINVLKFIINWAGFELVQRIELRDKKQEKSLNKMTMVITNKSRFLQYLSHKHN